MSSNYRYLKNYTIIFLAIFMIAMMAIRIMVSNVDDKYVNNTYDKYVTTTINIGEKERGWGRCMVCSVCVCVYI